MTEVFSPLNFRFRLQMIVGDFIANALAFVLTLYLRFGGDYSTIQLKWYIVSSLLIWLGLAVYFFFKNLYAVEYRPFIFVVFEVLKAVILIFMVFLSLTFFVRFVMLSRLTFGGYFLLIPAFILLERYIFHVNFIMARKNGKYCFPVILVDLSATGKVTEEVAAYLKNHLELGLQIIKQFDQRAFSLNQLETALTAIKHLRPLIMLVEGDKETTNEVVNYCEYNYVQLMVIPDVAGTFTAPYEVMEIGGIPLLRFKINPLTNHGAKIKRLIDLAASLVGIVLLSPFFLLLALLLRLDSPGPLFFKQKRLGHNGRLIWVYKFRTMYVDAEARLGELLEKDSLLREEYEATFKLKNDPRVTCMGSFLRKSSLDELPQLINVLKGEMSLIGPRPIVPEELEMYGEKANLILRVVPGMTGIWQTSGRSDVSYEERIKMDMLYINNWSVWLDFVILLKTVPAVIGRKGAC